MPCIPGAIRTRDSMKVHIVQQGECLSSLAARYGLAGWKQLHEHPANAELRKQRPNPNVLAPGDKVVVPNREPPKSLSAVTGLTHIIWVKLRMVKLRIALVDRLGSPYEGKRFIVTSGSREITGTTAPGGMVEVEVPATESTARLRAWLVDDREGVPPTIDRDLAIGHIDPIDTNSGLQGRLSNLGYGCPITNENDTHVDEQLLSAARSFRAKHGLPQVEQPEESSEVSEADEATKAYAERLLDAVFRKKLLAVYESSDSS